MNVKLNNLGTAIRQSYGRSKITLQKYSPEILLGAGIIGGVIAAVMAAKATLDAEAIIDEHKTDMEMLEQSPVPTDDMMNAKVRVYAKTGLEFGKLYGPAVGLGALSMACILSSHGLMNKRQVSLIAAYNLISDGFQSYRDRVVEEFGAQKDMEFKLGLRETKYTETQIEVGEDGQEKKVKTKKTGYNVDPEFKSIYARFFDESNPNFNRNSRAMNKAFLMGQQAYFNDILFLEGVVFLNDVYKALGFPVTKEGQLVGWINRSPKQLKEEKRDGYISFGLFDIDSPRTAREFVNEVNPSVLLDFNVDGIVFDLI